MKKKMTIEDLAEIIERTVAKKEDITEVRGDIAAMKDDMTVMKDDIADMKDDMTVMRDDMTVMKDDITTMSKRLDRVDQDLVDIKFDTAYLKARVSEIGNQEIEQLKERVTVLELKTKVKH